MTQKEALEILKLGVNVFLTGAAGTGKTHLLNQYISFLQKHRVPIGITASTGIAATHIGGVTIDSWSGMGIRNNLTDLEVKDLEHKMYLKLRYLSTKVLIIDEVSMLSAQKLDLLDRICQSMRGNSIPFGGMQIVLCGDFFQLPPVQRDGEKADFIFKSWTWHNSDIKICYLSEQFRQKDLDYINLLNSLRKNAVTNHELNLLAKSLNQILSTKINPTKLYTHNIDVDAINLEELQKINSQLISFQMTSTGIPTLVDALKKNCLVPNILELKKGALVMFVKNNRRKGYVNGTQGKIIGFKHELPVVETLEREKILVEQESWSIVENNKIKAEIRQLPLRLAWAITVHKSQGMTLDLAEIDLSKAFVKGMGYVALSRLKSFQGLRLLGINNLALQVNPEIAILDVSFQKLSEQETHRLLAMTWWQKTMEKRKFLYKLTS